jgi:hypothetical protein
MDPLDFMEAGPEGLEEFAGIAAVEEDIGIRGGGEVGGIAVDDDRESRRELAEEPEVRSVGVSDDPEDRMCG